MGMMVIPVINEKYFEEIVRKIKLVEPHVDWVQIDIADGVFTPNKNWGNPADLLNFETKAKIELHLMVKNPEEIIEDWLKIPLVKRVIFHFEATQKIEEIIEIAKKYQKEAGLAIGPKTSWEVLKPYLDKIKFVQILAVEPGPAGQTFDWTNIDKIKALKDFKKDVIIEVDGGVTPENARALKEAGSDIVNSSHYIFSNPNIAEAIRTLENI